MPRYDVNETHEIWLPVPAAEALRAARTVRSDEIRLFKPLLAIRTLPERFDPNAPKLDLSRSILDEFMDKGGFAMMEDRPDEVVLGSIGHFWKITGNKPLSRIRTTAQFQGFDEPGYTKVAFNFAALPEGDGSRLFTETRVGSTSDDARRLFGRYWWFVSAGSSLLRRSWLKAIQRRAAG
jgi:hypothetical protein